MEDRTFQTREWYKKYQDNITPIGLAFFQSDWDKTVKDFFHTTLNMKEPGIYFMPKFPKHVIIIINLYFNTKNFISVYEYDFPDPYIRPQEWFPRRKPFNIYMDKYRDPKQINKEYLLCKLKNEHPFRSPAPPLQFPNAHPFPKTMPSWLKLHEQKIRLKWGRINDV